MQLPTWKHIKDLRKTFCKSYEGNFNTPFTFFYKHNDYKHIEAEIS